jgi:hypothetical protein
MRSRARLRGLPSHVHVRAVVPGVRARMLGDGVHLRLPGADLVPRLRFRLRAGPGWLRGHDRLRPVPAWSDVRGRRAAERVRGPARRRRRRVRPADLRRPGRAVRPHRRRLRRCSGLRVLPRLLPGVAPAPVLQRPVCRLRLHLHDLPGPGRRLRPDRRWVRRDPRLRDVPSGHDVRRGREAERLRLTDDEARGGMGAAGPALEPVRLTRADCLGTRLVPFPGAHRRDTPCWIGLVTAIATRR